MSGSDHEIVSMEEGRAEKIVTEEQENETSKGGNQIVEKGKDLSDKAKENLNSLDNLLIDGEKQTTKATIPRIPDVLRNNQNMQKYLEPRLVSIGPYHHDKRNLKVTQDMKRQLAAKFIKDRGVNKEDVYLDILREIVDLRKCYELDKKNQYNDDDLAWMFLIDGCVVLFYIYSWFFHGTEFYESMGLKIVMDLLLLENQLPYRVPKLLVDACNDSDTLEVSIDCFIAKVAFNGLPYEAQPQAEGLHLLDLLWKSLIPSTPFHKKSSFLMKVREKFQSSFLEMIGTILWYFIVVPFSNTFNAPACRNIMELKEAGIKLKCSGTCYLTDISFSGGTLRLPSILINKLTALKFLNLVAHELSSTKFEVSAHLYFLATLIVRVEDVKELRINGILVNYNANDEEVVQLFQEIRANYDMFGIVAQANYDDIRTKIHYHCNKSYNAWKAQLKNKHFASPWSVIALVGAIVALSVTILQTIYTVLAFIGREVPPCIAGFFLLHKLLI